MYKKHLGHFIMVTLKYFFDFDHSFCHHAYMMFRLLPFMIRLAVSAAAGHLHDGLITVKEDLLAMKSNVLMYKEHLENFRIR